MRPSLPIVTFVVALCLTACGGSSTGDGAKESTEPAEPPTMTVSGELLLMDGVEELFENGDWTGESTGECQGRDGYSDIAPGTQLTVYDASGEMLALGELGTGTWEMEADQGGSLVPCTFPFTVADVPADDNVFSVEVSHRGKVNFSKDQAESVLLTLGG